MSWTLLELQTERTQYPAHKTNTRRTLEENKIPCLALAPEPPDQATHLGDIDIRSGANMSNHSAHAGVATLTTAHPVRRK